jgi:hypothetical protein
MAMRYFKQLQRELVAFLGSNIGDVPALLETNHHAEKLADCAAKPPRYLTAGQPLSFTCQQFEDV